MNAHKKTRTELWKPVVGLETDYEVSNYGRVRAIDREKISRNGVKMKFPQRVLKGHVHHQGYLRAYISYQHRFIHSLVMEAFVGPRPHKFVVNHKDGNKANNHISNLEWCTRSYNEKHAIATGLKICKPPKPTRGEDNKSAKLTEIKVRVIRAAHPSYTNVRLAEIFGVSPPAIRYARLGMTWKHIV